jgi:hypothetical protein
MDEGPLVEKRKSIGPGEVALLMLLLIKCLFLLVLNRNCMTHTAGFATRNYQQRETAKNVALVSDLCILNAFLLLVLVKHRWSRINGNVPNVRRLFMKCRKTNPFT